MKNILLVKLGLIEKRKTATPKFIGIADKIKKYHALMLSVG